MHDIPQPPTPPQSVAGVTAPRCVGHLSATAAGVSAPCAHHGASLLACDRRQGRRDEASLRGHQALALPGQFAAVQLLPATFKVQAAGLAVVGRAEPASYGLNVPAWRWHRAACATSTGGLPLPGSDLQVIQLHTSMNSVLSCQCLGLRTVFAACVSPRRTTLASRLDSEQEVRDHDLDLPSTGHHCTWACRNATSTFRAQLADSFGQVARTLDGTRYEQQET